MGVSFSIGGVSFSALAGASGRYALLCSPESPRYMHMRYHPPGTTGNLLVDGGEAGRLIRCRMRYIDSLATAESNKNSDEAAWENTEVSIVYASKTYLRCQLEPGGLKKIREPVAVGRSSLVFMDVEAVFMCDGGTS